MAMNGVRGVSGAGYGIKTAGRTERRGTGFAVAEPAPLAEPIVIAAAAISGLVAIQDEAAPVRRNHAARQGGEAVLRDLSKLQLALLGGQPSGAAAVLRETLARLPEAVDPQLNTILASIRLRASIELARRGCSLAHP
jgi:hypothetical protein